MACKPNITTIPTIRMMKTNHFNTPLLVAG